VFALEERAPGFAKLFFLLEASLLELQARPQGVALPELVDPPEAAVRTAQDTAARAAWAALPAGELSLLRSVAAGEGAPRWTWIVTTALAVALLCVPAGLWIAVVAWIRRSGLRAGPLRRAALLLLGVSAAVLIPGAALGAVGARLVLDARLSVVLLLVLMVAWCAALAVLGIDGWRRRDHAQQVTALLTAAYGALGVALAYVLERGGASGRALVWAVGALVVPALAALLVLSAGLWLRRRRVAAVALVLLVLLTVAAVVLAGLAIEPVSPFARAIADPQRYLGPISWLTGCARAPEAPTQEPTPTVAKEIEAERTEGVKEVEVTQVVAEEPQPAATASPTATPRLTPSLAPTGTPALTPPPSPPAPASEPSPPLLGQFVPETLYWAPEAITDQDGRLEIVLQLLDAPATWRLHAVASTLEGEVGDAATTIQVR
jgi:hypothetical protein